MSEERRIRFIREEPWIAMALRQLYLGVLPADLHKWLWDWVQDVGAAARSREAMVGFAVTLLYHAAALALITLLFGERGARLFGLK